MALCEDETDLLWFPPLQGAWVKRGEPADVEICGSNARRVLFGAIALRTGQRVLLAQDRQRAQDFCEFLEFLRWHYRGGYVALILDEDSSHRAFDAQQAADELGIELDFLPKRAPHLNAMDQLWRRGKQTVSANWQYSSIEEHVERFMAYIQDLTPHQALRKAGLLAPNAWLRDYVHRG